MLQAVTIGEQIRWQDGEVEVLLGGQDKYVRGKKLVQQRRVQ